LVKLLLLLEPCERWGLLVLFVFLGFHLCPEFAKSRNQEQAEQVARGALVVVGKARHLLGGFLVHSYTKVIHFFCVFHLNN